MEYLFGLTSGLYMVGMGSNHKVLNSHSIYNFIIDIMMKSEHEKDIEYIIQSMKINIGLTFYEDFKFYSNRKLDTNTNIYRILNKNQN